MKHRSDESKRSVTIRLPVGIDRMIGMEAGRLGIRRSALIERAIRKFFKLPKAA